MITKHNWFKTNLDLRTKENVNKFEVSIKPYYFDEEDFNASAARVVHELSIAHNDLYLCYSGGLDSEFVLKVFLENDRKITPVILSTPFNQTELEYAWKFCDNHNVVPVVLQYDKKSILEQLSQKTLLNGYVSILGGVNILIREYVQSVGGKMIHGSDEPIFENDRFYVSEWDFYSDYYSGYDCCGFFTYDMSLFYSYASQIPTQGDLQFNKSTLYGLEARPKMYWTNEIRQLQRKLCSNITMEEHRTYFTKEYIEQIISPYTRR